MSAEQAGNIPPSEKAPGEYGDTSSTVAANLNLPMPEPPFFRRRPDCRNGVVCADVRAIPCEDCDGRTCVYKWTQSIS